MCDQVLNRKPDPNLEGPRVQGPLSLVPCYATTWGTVLGIAGALSKYTLQQWARISRKEMQSPWLCRPFPQTGKRQKGSVTVWILERASRSESEYSFTQLKTQPGVPGIYFYSKAISSLYISLCLSSSLPPSLSLWLFLSFSLFLPMLLCSSLSLFLSLPAPPPTLFTVGLSSVYLHFSHLPWAPQDFRICAAHLSKIVFFFLVTILSQCFHHVKCSES